MPTYEEYLEQGGTLSQEAYDRLIKRAWAYLDAMTMGRINGALPPAVKARVGQAAFAVAEELNTQEGGGEVVSATNDGYSETYVTSGKTALQRMYSAAALYLAPTGLLYSGMGGCCCPC